MRTRGFEKISIHSDNKDIIMPRRNTKNSACYDFYLHHDVEIKPKGSVVIKTGIKSYFLGDEALFLYPRSSLGIKKGISLANTIGIIDSDYYNNVDNEGEIIVKLVNNSNETCILKKGERFCQAGFKKYLITDDDDAEGQRVGGIGSTGQ